MNPEFSRVVYLSTEASDITGDYKLPLPPVALGVESTLTGAGAVGAGDVLIKAFCSDAIGLTSWPAGLWTVMLFGMVSSATDTTQIKVNVYQRDSAGTETLLLTETSAEINDLAAAAVTITHTLATPTTTAATDRLVVKIYHLTDSASSKTTTLYLAGETHQSRILLPFSVPIGNADMFKGVYDPNGDGIIAGSGDGGTVIEYSIAQVSEPPTEDDIVNAFGTASSAGAGFVGIINSQGLGSNFYMCSSDGTYWFYQPMARAAAAPAGYGYLTFLAVDTFTDSNGVSL